MHDEWLDRAIQRQVEGRPYPFDDVDLPAEIQHCRTKEFNKDKDKKRADRRK